METSEVPIEMPADKKPTKRAIEIIEKEPTRIMPNKKMKICNMKIIG